MDLEAAALAAMDRFCEDNGFSPPEYRRQEIGNVVFLSGTAPNGREFAVSFGTG